RRQARPGAEVAAAAAAAARHWHHLAASSSLSLLLPLSLSLSLSLSHLSGKVQTAAGARPCAGLPVVRPSSTDSTATGSSSQPPHPPSFLFFSLFLISPCQNRRPEAPTPTPRRAGPTPAAPTRCSAGFRPPHSGGGVRGVVVAAAAMTEPSSARRTAVGNWAGTAGGQGGRPQLGAANGRRGKADGSGASARYHGDLQLGALRAKQGGGKSAWLRCRRQQDCLLAVTCRGERSWLSSGTKG
ncbi:unnamed protein product, partial [Urochloa humidicola]